MLFQAVMKFLSKLVEFKILVNWGMVHCLKGNNYTKMVKLQISRTISSMVQLTFTVLRAALN